MGRSHKPLMVLRARRRSPRINTYTKLTWCLVAVRSWAWRWVMWWKLNHDWDAMTKRHTGNKGFQSVSSQSPFSQRPLLIQPKTPIGQAVANDCSGDPLMEKSPLFRTVSGKKTVGENPCEKTR